MNSDTGPLDSHGQWLAFRALQIGRVVAILACLVAIQAIGYVAGTTSEIDLVFALLLFDLLLTFPYVVMAKRLSVPLPELALAILLMEVFFVTVGEYLWGGENAVYGLPLYGFLVVMAASLHSQRAAALVAYLSRLLCSKRKSKYTT